MDALLKEGRSLQLRFPKTNKFEEHHLAIACSFSNWERLELLAKGGLLRSDQLADPNESTSKSVGGLDTVGERTSDVWLPGVSGVDMPLSLTTVGLY